jgi:hypothetical protein
MVEFVIAAYDQKYFPYLVVLVQSIDDVYNGSAHIKILTTDINKEDIDKISKKISNVSIEYMEWSYRNVTERYKRPSIKLNMWYNHIIKTENDRLVFLDCDMLLMRKIDNFLLHDFDIGYTYKTDHDENLNLPINAGTVLVKKSNRTILFMKTWMEQTNKMLQEPQKNRKHTDMWGAADQAVFGLNIGTRDKYSKPIIIDGVKFVGFKCKELNETRCVPITDILHIIHYKARWREVIPHGTFTNWRPKEKCFEMYKLWMDKYRRFMER